MTVQSSTSNLVSGTLNSMLKIYDGNWTINQMLSGMIAFLSRMYSMVSVS